MITGNSQDKSPVTVVTELTTINLSRNINDRKEVNATATNDAANPLAKEKKPDEVRVVDKKQEENLLIPQRTIFGENLDIRCVQIDAHGLPKGDVVTSDEYYSYSYSDSYVSGAESVSSYSDTSSSEYVDSEYEEEEEDTHKHEASNKNSLKLASKRTDEKNEISSSLDDKFLAAIRQKIEQEIEKKEHLTK